MARASGEHKHYDSFLALLRSGSFSHLLQHDHHALAQLFFIAFTACLLYLQQARRDQHWRQLEERQSAVSDGTLTDMAS